MGILSKVIAPFQRKNSLSQYGTLEESQFWTELSKNHPWPGAGDHFSVMAALRAGMVIAQGIGQMPLHVKKMDTRDGKLYRQNATDNRAYKLLNKRPNDWMTSVELREAMTLHAVFTGAGRAFVRRGVDGRPLELLPLHPRWVNAYHDETTKEMVYEIGIAEYGIYGKYSRDDIIEITNPRWDFISGMDITRKAATALGLAQSLESRQAKLTERNAPYGIVTSESAQSLPAMQAVKTAWKAQFGEGNGIGFVDFAAKFQQMMGTPADQQSIENRKFQIEEVARAFGVFPALLMHSDKTSTFASAESFFQAHLVHTLGPWVARWEQALDRTLFDGSSKLYADFDERSLARMTPSDQMEWVARALGSGGNKPVLTQNEAREFLGYDPHPDGDDLDLLQAAPAVEDDGVEAEEKMASDFAEGLLNGIR